MMRPAAAAILHSLTLTIAGLLHVVSISRCDAFAHSIASRSRRCSPFLHSSSAIPATVNGETFADGGEGDTENMYSELIRQEETVIFSLIERAQFCQNNIVYKVGGIPGLGTPPGSENASEEEDELSFLEYMLAGTEALHSMVDRYESPEEHAFFPSRLPKQTRFSKEDAGKKSVDVLAKDAAIKDLNWNKILLEKYINVVVPAVCAEGDDDQYGSTVVNDITVLQVLSRRIHFGKFIAENKYQSDPEGFRRLINAGDVDGVKALLLSDEEKKMVLTRSKLKASTYGREPLLTDLPLVPNGEDKDTTSIIAAAAASAVVAAVEAIKKSDGDGVKGKMDPSAIECIARDVFIPMEVDIGVAYLFLRCAKELPAEYSPDKMSAEYFTGKFDVGS